MGNNQQNSQSILPNIAQGIGLLMVFVFSYFGLNYIFEGNMVYSFSLAFFIILFLFLLVAGMVSMKKKRQNTGFTVVEGLALLLYLGVAAASFFVMTHFINIELLKKREIREAGTEKLEELDKMLASYQSQVDDAVNDIELSINTHINAYRQDSDLQKLKDNLNAYGITIESQTKSEALADAENRMQSVLDTDRDLAMEGFAELKKETEGFIADKQLILRNWDRSQLHWAFSQIDKRLVANRTALEAMFREDNREHWNQYAFEFETSPPQDDIISGPWALIEKYQPSWLIPIVLAIVIHLFILLPYLLLKREGKRVYYSGKETGRGIKV